MFSRGELSEIQAGVKPLGCMHTVTFDGGIQSGKLSTKAALTTTLTGTNNDMVFTAKTAGIAGNLISVEYRDTFYTPGHSAATVSVTGKAIKVDLKTSAGVAASTVLTSNNTNVTAGKVVVVNDITYTFSANPTALYQVKVGASADASLLSLAKTINGTGVAGTDMFVGTPAHPTVSSTDAVDTHTITLSARSVGTAGNAYPSTTDEATLSFTGLVFASGEDVNQILSTAAQVKTAFDNNAEAAALVDSVANSGADDGSGVVTTLAATALAGGSDGKVPLFDVTGGVICSLRGYVETDLAGNTATLVHGVTGTTNMLISILTSTTIVKPKGIDKNGLVNRGTALDKIPLWYVQDEQIFATTATAATSAGKIHYILDYIKLTDSADVVAA